MWGCIVSHPIIAVRGISQLIRCHRIVGAPPLPPTIIRVRFYGTCIGEELPYYSMGPIIGSLRIVGFPLSIVG